MLQRHPRTFTFWAREEVRSGFSKKLLRWDSSPYVMGRDLCQAKPYRQGIEPKLITYSLSSPNIFSSRVVTAERDHRVSLVAPKAIIQNQVSKLGRELCQYLSRKKGGGGYALEPDGQEDHATVDDADPKGGGLYNLSYSRWDCTRKVHRLRRVGTIRYGVLR